jgi:hypothetical protein
MLMLMILAQLTAQPCVPNPMPCSPTPPACTPNLVVEVVDHLNLPLPGARVKVKARRNAEVEKVLSAGVDGLAQFCVAGGAEYEVRVDLTSFKKKRVRSQTVPRPSQASSPVRIRIQMVFNGRMETVE